MNRKFVVCLLAFSASIAYNANHWLSGVADFGGYHSNNILGTGVDGTLFPRPTSVTITLSPPLWPEVSENGTSDWHEVVRLRDSAREQIARHSGEPLV